MTDIGYAKLSYFVFGLALGLLTMALAVTVLGTRAPTKGLETRDTPGCPLDAVSYDTPVWLPECWGCFRVTDRVSGQSWWLLRTKEGRHVVLSLDELSIDQNPD